MFFRFRQSHHSSLNHNQVPFFCGAVPKAILSLGTFKLPFEETDKSTLPADVLEFYEGYLRYRDLQFYCKCLKVTIKEQRKRASRLEFLGEFSLCSKFGNYSSLP